jgi:hypothetical protein
LLDPIKGINSDLEDKKEGCSNLIDSPLLVWVLATAKILRTYF